MASEPNQVQTIFMAMFAALWFGCSNAVREIVDEQTIYRRERQTGLKIPSYVLSKLAVLSFVALVQCVSVVVILLGGKALDLSLPEILAAIAIMFLVAVNGTLIGLLISSLVSTPEKALTIFPLVLIPELLLCGLFLPVNRIQTIIPITVEQLFEGKMFAQPEAKAKAQEMIHPPAAPSAAPATAPAGAPTAAAPTPAEQAAEAGLKQGEAAHDVTAAMAPSEQVEKAFHKYTPAPVAGMPTAARWLSVLAISRWGLEALSDLCLHGRHSMQDSAYKIINTVSISLHPDDVDKLEQGLESPTATGFALPDVFWKDKGPYLGIMAGYAVAMVIAILILMKRKDVS
jgi:hypothetical protein